MQMAEMAFQWTTSLMLRPLTKAMPIVSMNCMSEASDPRMSADAISTMYSGAASANEPAAKPKTKNTQLFWTLINITHTNNNAYQIWKFERISEFRTVSINDIFGYVLESVLLCSYEFNKRVSLP